MNSDKVQNELMKLNFSRGFTSSVSEELSLLTLCLVIMSFFEFHNMLI